MLLASAAMRIIDSIEHLRSGMDYHLARHNLLTTNLAHVDTPGYRPLDLAQRAGFEGALHTAMATTDADHIGGSSGASGASGSSGPTGSWEVVEDPSAPEGADGNGVRLDREAVKIASNNLRYDALATLVQGQLASLAWAANDGRGG